MYVLMLYYDMQVTVVGDGSGQTLTVAGDKLWNADAIVKVGGEVPLPTAIKDTHKKLSTKVFEYVTTTYTCTPAVC